MFIVSYINVPFIYYEGADPLNTFQIILYEGTNDIQVNYLDVRPRESARHTTTAGIENSNGTAGLQYQKFNTPGRYRNLYVMYYLGDSASPPPSDDGGSEPPPDDGFGSGEDTPPSNLFPDGSLFFPYIALDTEWNTTLYVINQDSSQAQSGVFRSYDEDGTLVSETGHITIAPNARYALPILDLAGMAGNGAYMVFVPDSESANFIGYERFYSGEEEGETIPAAKEGSALVLDIPHLASSANWRTRIVLINIKPDKRAVQIQFDSGESVYRELNSGQQLSFSVRELLGGEPRPDIHSARIFASGLVGIALFTSVNGDYDLSGILLQNDKEKVICYPHVVLSENWYSALVAYTYSSSCDLTITPYSAQGEAFPALSKHISRSSRFVGTFSSLGLPEGTAWLKIEGTKALAGFQLLGSKEGGLAGFDCTTIKKRAGAIPGLDGDGIAALGMVNTEDSEAHVTLTAFQDDGEVLATKSISIPAHAKIAGTVMDLFGQEVEGVSYVTFSSDRDLVGFQVGISDTLERADALPIL